MPVTIAGVQRLLPRDDAEVARRGAYKAPTGLPGWEGEQVPVGAREDELRSPEVEHGTLAEAARCLERE